MPPRSWAARRRGAALLAALVLLAVLVWVDRGLFGREHFETSDFAANSLLVQDAKALELVTGNYSRIGFHHPGPAILYVLAGGEYFLHDVLHWVRSPIAGQVAAGLAWNAAWCAALFSIFAAMLGTNRAAMSAAAVFLAATAWGNGQLLLSIWMPSLYYMPFAVLIAALARLASGHGDRLALLALSAAFLMHGHASFLVMIPPMGVAAWVLGAWWSKRPRQPIAGAALAVLREPRGEAIAAAAIATLFALPLVVQTVRGFPGPLAAYFAYGGESTGNGWLASIAFVVRYWGSLPVLAVACVVLAVFVRGSGRERPPAARDAAFGTLAAFAIASAMVFVYAKQGVDDLGHWYVAMFYGSAPIVVEAVAAALLLGLLPFALPVAVATVAASLAIACKALAPSELMVSPEAPVLARALESFPRPIVLDLDNRVGEAELWSSVLGATAYLRRRDGPHYCIRRNWHISYTHALRCTSAEEERGNVVTAAWARGPVPGNPAVVADGIALVPTAPPAISWGVPVSVSASGPLPPALLGAGWSNAEEHHTWSVGEYASMSFRIPEAVGFELRIEMAGFLPPSRPRQAVKILVNGRVLQSIELVAPTNWREIAVQVPKALVEGRGHVVVGFEVAHPLSPRAARAGNDARRLGVALKGFVARPES